MSGYCVVEVVRLIDGFRQRTAMGSAEGCTKEAKAIVSFLIKEGQDVTMMGPGDWQSDEGVLVEVWPLTSSMPDRPIEWSPGEFSRLTISRMEAERAAERKTEE